MTIREAQPADHDARLDTGRVQIQKVDVNGDGLLDVVARATVNGKKRTRTFVT